MLVFNVLHDRSKNVTHFINLLETDDSAHAMYFGLRRLWWQMPLIRARKTQVGQTSPLTETDNSAQWAEYISDRIIRLPKFKKSQDTTQSSV